MGDEANTRRFPVIKTAVLTVVGVVIIGALVFWPAGTFDWWQGWAYSVLLFGAWAISFGVMLARNPELMRRRMKAGEGTKRWDRQILGLMRLAAFAIFIVAGFDAVRYGWTEMPLWLWPLGCAAHLAGYTLITWGMLANTHFEGTVRIQQDRGHRVCDTGPYRFVRHPGYVGFSAIMLAVPLLLGSWWALIPAALTVALIVLRTAREDRTLQRELDGYAAFASRTRYRLLPGVW